MKVFCKPRVAAICLIVCLAAISCHSSENLLDTLPPQVVLKTPEGPGVDSTSCQGLWYQTGFLCNKKKLLRFREKDSQKMKESLEDFENTLGYLQTLGRSVKKNQRKLKDIDPSVMGFLKNFTKEARVEESRSKAKLCWHHMDMIRASALCTICSAKNHQFFFKSKGIISMTSCKMVLNDCEGHLEDILSIIKLMGELKEMAEDFSLSEHKFMLFDLIATINQVVAKLIIQYNSSSSEYMREVHAAQICEMIINLSKTPTMARINESFLKVTKIFLDELHSKKNRDLGLFQPNSRNLRGGLGSESLDKSAIEQDIIVIKQSDNIFMAFDGAKGTPLEIDSGSHRPMNMSLTFP